MSSVDAADGSSHGRTGSVTGKRMCSIVRQVSAPVTVGVLMCVLAWWSTAQGTPHRLLLVTAAGVVSAGTVSAHRWLSGRLGTWTAWLALALLWAGVLAALALLTPQCVNSVTRTLERCSAHDGAAMAGSVLLLPIIAVLVAVPVKLTARFLRRAARVVWLWGRQPIRAQAGGKSSAAGRVNKSGARSRSR